MKKKFALIAATVLVVGMAVFAIAGTFFGEAVDTTGKTKIVGQTIDMKSATGQTQVVMLGYSSEQILRARTGSGTGWQTITTCTSTSATRHTYTFTKPYKEAYVCYTALCKVGRTLRSDCAGW